jgi:sulfide dehydrogenase cytochrome subunit
MKRLSSWGLLGGAALSTLAVTAQASDTQTRTWAASCSTCHGTQGHSQGGIPSLAGVDKAQLLQKLLAYQQGSLPASVMHQHAKGYTGDELERIADFFSRQAR